MQVLARHLAFTTLPGVKLSPQEQPARPGRLVQQVVERGPLQGQIIPKLNQLCMGFELS